MWHKDEIRKKEVSINSSEESPDVGITKQTFKIIMINLLKNLQEKVIIMDEDMGNFKTALVS